MEQVPEKITLDNMFGEHTKRFENNHGRFHPGVLNAWSRVMFHPTEKELDDQCFNLDFFLTAFIMPRLIYFRDHGTGVNLTDHVITNDTSGEEFANIYKESDEIYNKMLEGFWIGLNIDDMDATPEQAETWKNARMLLAKYWERFWC